MWLCSEHFIHLEALLWFAKALLRRKIVVVIGSNRGHWLLTFNLVKMNCDSVSIQSETNLFQLSSIIAHSIKGHQQMLECNLALHSI